MGRIELTRTLESQILAALSMLEDCIERCPAAEWNESRGDYPFSQVLFHALFDCDYHLCDREAELREQAFHKANRETFAGYEELGEGRSRRLFERAFIEAYFEHCREKVSAVLEAREEAELLIPNSDVTGTMTRLERYLNLLRHLQHHAAQLGLRLQLLSGQEMEWIGRGPGR